LKSDHIAVDHELVGVFDPNPKDQSIPSLTILPLGAGQDVGRSCLIVTFATGRTVMLDCGMHMGYSDRRMYPDFSYITRNQDLTNSIDAVLISHFHLDHCGALPYMSESVGYNGPIVMSHPTKAICPILLEDFRRILGSKASSKSMNLGFKPEDIQNCLAKVTCINVHQTINITPDLQVKAVCAKCFSFDIIHQDL
jgi:integrator complex subunit 11